MSTHVGRTAHMVTLVGAIVAMTGCYASAGYRGDYYASSPPVVAGTYETGYSSYPAQSAGGYWAWNGATYVWVAQPYAPRYTGGYYSSRVYYGGPRYHHGYYYNRGYVNRGYGSRVYVRPQASRGYVHHGYGGRAYVGPSSRAGGAVRVHVR